MALSLTTACARAIRTASLMQVHCCRIHLRAMAQTHLHTFLAPFRSTTCASDTPTHARPQQISFRETASAQTCLAIPNTGRAFLAYQPFDRPPHPTISHAASGIGLGRAYASRATTSSTSHSLLLPSTGHWDACSNCGVALKMSSLSHWEQAFRLPLQTNFGSTRCEVSRMHRPRTSPIRRGPCLRHLRAHALSTSSRQRMA